MGQSPHDVESIARSYDSSIIVRRWIATWIDFLLLLLMIAGIGTAIPEAVTGLEIAVALAIPLAYYLALEGATGLTLGKLITRIRVVDNTGRRPRFAQTLVRTALRLIEVNPFILGGVPAGLAAGFSKTRQRLGDMLAHTYVVRARDLAGPAAIESQPSQSTSIQLPPVAGA